MLRYYPSFRVKTNLVAGENLFNTSDGAKYTGPYYETSDGRFFSGPNPIIGPNKELKRVVAIKNVPGLAGILDTQVTNGNEFLLDGVPYVGPYYQDFAGNYYTVPTTDPSSIAAPNVFPESSNGINPPDLAALQSQGAQPANQVQGPTVISNIQSTSPGSQNVSTPNQANVRVASQTLAGLAPNIVEMVNGGAKPLNEIIVDSKGNRFVRGPQNELIPYEQAQKSLQDSQKQSQGPRLLQPIASKVPPPGSSQVGRRTSPASLQQQFIFNTRINPNFTGQPTPFYPSPTEDDYRRGYFTRYFVKKTNQNGYIIEISLQEYSKINEGTVSYDVSNYQTQSTFWKISGSLRTVRLSQYDIRDGIIDTNKRLIENLEKTFVGIKAFIGGQYDKFAKPTQ